MPGQSEVWRRRSSMALAGFGALLALAGGVLLYAREEIFDSEHLADRAKSALGDQRFRLAVAQPIVDGILDDGPAQLVNARPVIESVVVAALGTPPVEAAFGEAVKSVDAKLFENSPNTLLLNLTDAAVIAANTLDSVSPQLSSKVPKQVEAVKTTILESDLTITPLSHGRQLRFLGIALPILALLMLGAAVGIATDRRRAVQRVGAAIAVAAAGGLALLVVARSLTVAQFDDPLVHDAVAALWDALLGDLSTWIVAIGLIAVIGAAAAKFGAAAVDPLSPLSGVAALARRRPGNPVLAVLRGLTIVLAGVALIVEPVLSLSVIAIGTGTWLLYVATVELLAVLAPPLPESRVSDGRVSRRLRPARIGLAVGAVAVVVAIVVLSGGGESAPARPPGPPAACNGYVELCSKRLDEVTFPATHNSMSAAEEPGWFLPNQRYGITRQLDDGIRALLIDTHYGIRRGEGRGFGNVITDLQRESKTRDEVVAELGEETVARAEALVGNLAFSGSPPGEPEPFLCHVLCELGATDLDVALNGIDDWMGAHPDEFLIIFIEDVVGPKETVDALRRSGLLRYAYSPEAGVPGPTLGELIEGDRRLLVMAERDAGGGKYPQYVQGFDLVQETPFTFGSEAEITSPAGCRPNRGGAANPLFQINNWIEKVPRDPELAAKIDSKEVLGARSRLCARLRGLEPNIIAVDYYDRGDVLGVANALNGLADDATPSVRTLP